MVVCPLALKRGPQMIPRPEMIPANSVAKNREWREKSMDVYFL